MTTLINQKYLKEFSPIPLNFNLDDIKPYIYLAEEIWIKPCIGGILFDELKGQIEDGKISPENQTLLLEIYRLEAFAICYEALPAIVYHMSEVGITKGKSENSESIDIKELNYLQQNLRSQLEVRRDYFLHWLTEFGGNYPYLILPPCKPQKMQPLYKPCNPCKDIK